MRVLGALTAFEIRQIVRSVPFLVAVSGMGLLTAYGLSTREPQSFESSLVNRSWELQFLGLAGAAAALVMGSMAAVRHHQHGTTAQESACPEPAWARFTAQAIALLIASGLLSAVQVMGLLVEASSDEALSQIAWKEVANLPAILFLSGVVGLCAGAAFRSLAAVIPALVIVGVLTILGVLAPYDWAQLMPTDVEDSFQVPPIPLALDAREAWGHAGWLLAIAALLFACLCAVSAQGRARISWIAGGLVSVLLCSMLGAQQLSAVALTDSKTWQSAYADPASLQECRMSEGMTLCSFDGFEHQTQAWSDVIASQLSFMPQDAVPTGLAVVQRLEAAKSASDLPPELPLSAWRRSDLARGLQDTIPVSTRWTGRSTDSYAQTQVLAFGLTTGHRLVTGRALSDERPGPIFLCGGEGVLVGALAIVASPRVGQAHDVVMQHTVGMGLDQDVLGSSTVFMLGSREYALVAALRKLPRDQAGDVIRARWHELVQPNVSIDEAAAMLRLPVPPPADASSGVCAP